jgi:hypothetical protein
LYSLGVSLNRGNAPLYRYIATVYRYRPPLLHSIAPHDSSIRREDGFIGTWHPLTVADYLHVVAIRRITATLSNQDDAPYWYTEEMEEMSASSFQCSVALQWYLATRRRINAAKEEREQTLDLSTAPSDRASAPGYRYNATLHRYNATLHRYIATLHRYKAPVYRYTAPLHWYVGSLYRGTAPNHRYTAPFNPCVLPSDDLIATPCAIRKRREESVTSSAAPSRGHLSRPRGPAGMRPSPDRCEPAGHRRPAPGGSRSCPRSPGTARAP